MASKALIGYAVLKRLHDDRRDILEAYTPFVEFAIAKQESTHTDIQSLQEFVRADFGLEIPTNTVRTILRRLARNGLITALEGYNYVELHTVDDKLIADFQESVDESIRERNDLLQDYKTNSGRDKTDDELLSDFVDFILTSLENKSTHEDKVVDSSRQAIAAYVAHIKEYDNRRYHAFQRIYYGAILSQVASLGNSTAKIATKNSLTVYLDSNILFRVLNLQNPVYNKSSQEFLGLLKAHGFQVRCFQKSVDEMRGVLAHRRSLMLSGKIPEHIPEIEARHIDGIIGAFYRRGMRLSDIDSLSAKLELEIEKSGIKVDDQDFLDPIKVPLQLLSSYYEKKLRHHLGSRKIDDFDRDYDIDKILPQADVPVHIQKMVRAKCEIDTKIVGCIRKWRGNRDIYNMPDAKFVFVTCDRQLFRHNREPEKVNRIPEVMMEDQFTTILWIADPDRSGDLPLELAISAYAATKFFDFRILRKFNDYLGRVREETPERFQLIGDIFQNQEVVSQLMQIENSDKELTDQEFENLIEISRVANEKRASEMRAKLQSTAAQRNDAEQRLVLQERDQQQLKDRLHVVELARENANLLNMRLLNVAYWAIPIIYTIVFLFATWPPFVHIFPIIRAPSHTTLLQLLISALPDAAVVWVWLSSTRTHRKFYEALRYVINGKRTAISLLGIVLCGYFRAIWSLVAAVLIPLILSIIANHVS